MTFTFGIFINILFGMAVIDERVRPTSFSPVIKVNLSASVTKRAIGFSLITFQSGAHMFSHFKLFLLISNSMLKSDKLSFFFYLFHSNIFFFGTIYLKLRHWENFNSFVMERRQPCSQILPCYVELNN
jgi:hypothetical protein